MVDSVSQAESHRYVFTVTAGRSGQLTLTDILRRHVPDCYAAFEEPTPRWLFKGVLGQIERRFRRRFFETDELLGRGAVLSAYDHGDREYLIKIARRRIAMIGRRLKKTRAHTYIDVSKFFARGLHVGFRHCLCPISLIHLVRDPIHNMRSFLNRSKVFAKDNCLPDSPSNILRLDCSDMQPGEFYLWAWCEMYLRFDAMITDGGIDRWAEIRTEHLNNYAYMGAALDALGFNHGPISGKTELNTNRGLGLGETVVNDEDIAIFHRFLARLPDDIRSRLTYFNDYDPTGCIAPQPCLRAGAASRF